MGGSGRWRPAGWAATEIVGAFAASPALQFVGEQQVGQLDWLWRAHGCSRRSHRRSSKWILPPLVWALLATNTTWEPSTGSRLFSSRPVSAKWPRWLCRLSSNPSAVVCLRRRVHHAGVVDQQVDARVGGGQFGGRGARTPANRGPACAPSRSALPVRRLGDPAAASRCLGDVPDRQHDMRAAVRQRGRCRSRGRCWRR